jgi:hypothetical protein
MSEVGSWKMWVERGKIGVVGGCRWLSLEEGREEVWDEGRQEVWDEGGGSMKGLGAIGAWRSPSSHWL